MMLADLQETWRRLTATPIMVAVWCVDRPDALWRIRELVKGEAPRSFASECPVYEWYARYADDFDWARRPTCFCIPGVYMQMSDGDYIRVKL